MNYFHETPYFSEMIERSHIETVVIFKYSSACGSSQRLYEQLEKMMGSGAWKTPVYVVTVQIYPALSKNIAEMFDIKHESPQIIILKDGKVIYEAHHGDVVIEKLVLE